MTGTVIGQAVEAHHAALLEAHDFETGWNWNCAEIYNDFSYQKMGLIHLYEAMHITDDEEQTLSLFIQDGNHRCLALACLLLQGKIEWQPISVLALDRLRRKFPKRRTDGKRVFQMTDWSQLKTFLFCSVVSLRWYSHLSGLRRIRNTRLFCYI